MSNRINFNEFKTGTLEGNCALIKVSEEQISKTGNPYINLFLFGEDGSSKSISLFTKKSDFTIPEKSVIKAKFSYKGDFCNISNIEAVPDEKITEYVRCAPVPPQECFSRVMKTLESLKYESENITLYEIAIAVLNKYKDKLMYFPASESFHHTYIGGLIYHIMCMVMDAFLLVKGKVYDVDKEIVISAVAVNTICKVFTLSCDEISAENNIYNYLYNDGELSIKTIDYVKDELCKSTGKNVDKTKYLNFSACIKSYKGKPAWGASIYPLTEESYMVTMINQLDCHLNQYEEAKKTVEKNKLSEFIEGIYTKVLNI